MENAEIATVDGLLRRLLIAEHFHIPLIWQRCITIYNLQFTIYNLQVTIYEKNIFVSNFGVFKKNDGNKKTKKLKPHKLRHKIHKIGKMEAEKTSMAGGRRQSANFKHFRYFLISKKLFRSQITIDPRSKGR